MRFFCFGKFGDGLYRRLKYFSMACYMYLADVSKTKDSMPPPFNLVVILVVWPEVLACKDLIFTS